MSEPENTFRVFKYNDDRTDQTWNEVGTLEAEWSYLGPDEQQIGELGGAGTYLLIRVDNRFVIPRTIVGYTKWEAAEEETAEEVEA